LITMDCFISILQIKIKNSEPNWFSEFDNFT
jgi:hypothetical protein